MRVSRSAGACCRRSAASLFFDKYLGFKKSAEIILIFAGNTRLYRLYALVSRGGIKIQAVAAGVQVVTAVFAAVRNLNLPVQLYFSRAVVAARYKMELRFHPVSAFVLTFSWAGNRLGFAVPV